MRRLCFLVLTTFLSLAGPACAAAEGDNRYTITGDFSGSDQAYYSGVVVIFEPLPPIERGAHRAAGTRTGRQPPQ